ncbi:penicillin-binding protein 2 [Lutimaribacter sp. EGI FJ00015]|uniref:Penicillin-binding protein 2 n=1 Tax=Lutimaribacter degradans TaxID=2945989 RepID=A0ACC6A1A9_9RHOB|nr:penicillin-binding protein 2 [Lutimaribacter sp. EGI FJ00013]MCM2563529.1 penicillin-binding protein 2 [Lutimaribacter sp. EGI FJ00013]MCO0614709.1 penicillin-binding protein 2 [Lutimaribacter sp. EGI FJ00015]MCO0637379.1 penicillin-binding protein 2 [Lutimaribacter sp. EGI FJ00014]
MRRNPKDNQHSVRRMTRRALMLGGAQAAFIGVLGLRMRHLQVEQADQFRLLAEENRINIRLIPPARGQIFDRNGRVIAENVPSYRITMVPEDTGDPDLVLRRLAALIDLAPEDVDRVRTTIDEVRGDTPVTIVDRVSWEDLSKVAVNGPALPGITPEVGLSRHYPRGLDYAHVVGRVGPVSSFDLEQIENPDPLLRIPRFQIGKVGVEAKAEEILRGRAGIKRVEVNAAGRVMRELDRREGEAGVNLQLTVDSALQEYTQARLATESAAAVVMDCETGDLLAVASAPSYDPNLFVRGISSTDYSALIENKYRPLVPKTVQGLYPPGSTFKMVTALAALEAGIVTPEDTVYCPGHLEVSDRRFHCWKRAGHGSMDLRDSLSQSCDVYYYDLALKVGIEKISDMARRLGLGVAFDVPMSSVKAGVAPTRDYKRERFGQEWVIGDTVNASIGQGFVLASPMQLAVMSARLATGRAVTPRLIKSIDGVEQPSGHGDDLGLDPGNLRQVRRAMYAVSNHRRGTAYGSRILAEGYQMAGKTGTSQVRNITAEERRRGVTRNEDLPWDRRDHALFVNFAPYDAPKIAVAVVVEHGGGGSSVAAPVARDITLQALYGDTPPLEAYPASDRSRAKALQDRLQREREAREREAQSRA